jgi:uncharacterized protein GlcG (DUF336 family)
LRRIVGATGIRLRDQGIHASRHGNSQRGELIMPRRFRMSAAIGATIALSSTASAEGVIMQRQLSLSLAATIAHAAMEECRKMGEHQSVTVLDRAGHILVVLRDEASPPHTIDFSRRKAYTARMFEQPSREFVDRIRNNPASAGLKDAPDVIASGGGIPIKVGDEVIGAVGVSGAHNGRDEPCALAGLARVADQLK